MSQGDVRSYFLHSLPAPVNWEFCRVMDGLSDLDWTRFASAVLGDQVSVRLAERKERRTDDVMSQWGNKNGRVGELLDLLEHQQLLRARDVILHCELLRAERALPRPAPPPSSLHSGQPRTLQGPALVVSGDADCGVMCWSYEEVHAGTEGFSPALQIGEGGFGVVYRARLKNTDCAVKRLKQDCMQDLNIKETFNAEVEKLSKFRHPNIVDLLGFCQGPSVCLIYSYMENRSLEDQLHSVSSTLTWPVRVRIVHEASAALQYLHSPPDGRNSVIHGDVKSSNILLDRHLVTKLADFGLARFASPNTSSRLVSKTTTVGQKSKVRGTLAYLPEEYLRSGQPRTPVDVYSFGVVLLEVLTGRRALETAGPPANLRSVFTIRLSLGLTEPLLTLLVASGGDATELAGSMQMVELACGCLNEKWKKRPTMTEVFDRLQDISDLVRKSDLVPTPHCVSPGYRRSSDASVEVLAQQLSKLGPLEDTYQPPIGTCPPPPPFTRTSPCETDESRGFSQYDLSAGSQINSKLSSLSPHTSEQDQNRTGATKSRSREPSEDQYNLHDRIGPGHPHRPHSGPQIAVRPGPSGSEISSPPAPLQSLCPQTSGKITKIV
uniref:Interleukin 1 receptor associated kinase 1 n=1 Tax=Hippocampus comes TaxID=109280 RepID=A0A3Q2Y5E1_HIPCM